MIYIDPPYNTGKDFVYKDNFTKGVADYYEQTGQTKDGIKMTANTEKNGRYHSDWLTMMYPRLFLAHNLLREDGVIFVSIDDNEVANLRMIMDEIFGEENFVAQIIWKKKTNGNNVGLIPNIHDYVIVYSKNIESESISGYERTDMEKFKNPDNDTKGPWTTMDLSANHKGPHFAVKNPTTGELHYPAKGRYWVFNEKEILRRILDGRIIFGKTGTTGPIQKVFWEDKKDTKFKAETLWDKHGLNADATAELGEIFEIQKIFDAPKPVSIIKHMLQISTLNDDLILDFFAGSGTTAHAVMALNAEDGGNRRCISVQLPEATDESSEAFKAGYTKISDITSERIRRAGDKIASSRNSREGGNPSLDVGFKSFVLASSNYRQWNTLTDSDDAEALKAQMKIFAEKPLVDDFDIPAVVYEILVKEGLNLNSLVKEVTVGDMKVWKVKDGERNLVITFQSSITQVQAELLKLTDNDTFVCFDSALDDTTKVNLARNFIIKVI